MARVHYEFVELPAFVKRLEETGDKELLGAVQEALLKDPDAGVLLKGGIRKLRVHSPAEQRGKRGGYRVWHYFYRVGETIYLLDKRQAANISKAQEARLVNALNAALGGR